VRFVLDITGAENIFEINQNTVKKELKISEINEENAWRVNIVKELVNLKQNILTSDENENSLTNKELEEIL
jgi:hypothetical protein